jgi:hypothetical protein
MLGTGLTALSHFGFALLADGFWSALLLHLLAGIGRARTCILVAGASRRSPTRWKERAMARLLMARRWCRDLRCGLLRDCRPRLQLGRILGLVSPRRRDRVGAVLIAATVMPSALPARGTFATAARFPAGAAQPGDYGPDYRICRPHLGACCLARLGRDPSRRRLCQPGSAVLAARSDRAFYPRGSRRHRRLGHRQ